MHLQLTLKLLTQIFQHFRLFSYFAVAANAGIDLVLILVPLTLDGNLEKFVGLKRFYQDVF